MPSIDDRVVAMSFENTKFEAGVATTLTTLSKLDTAIKNIGATNGLQNIEASANKVTLQGPMSALDKLKAKLGMATAGSTFTDLERSADKVTLAGPQSAIDKLRSKFGLLSAGKTFDNIEAEASHVSLRGVTNAIENASHKFSVLKTAAAVALGGIAATAASKGAAVVKSLTLGPVLDGFKNYETQINAVQTIMANTGLTGPKGLAKVSASLNELNKYANQTVYNFSEMARNIGTFTAAGVDLKTATASIKGIANLAALSGSNSQQASTAMYQLSQAIAAGRVNLQDWNSVVNAGMGGAVFQKALMRTGAAMGTIAKGAYKVDKATGKATINGESFRNSIMAKPGQQSWLTSDVLTKTLEQFTGDLSDAQLKSQGFSDAQIKAIQAQAKAARGAAVNIKTVSQLMDALKEEVGTAWATVFKTLFGNIFDATKLFSGLHVVAENALTGPIYAVNKVLEGWAKLGGRTNLIAGLKQGFEDLKAVIDPIKAAFRDIFPPATARGLADLTSKFKDLMQNFKIGPATAENLRRTFDGLFAVLHIGWTIIKDVGKVLFNLFGVAGKGAGGILKFTGTIGDFLKAIDNAISKGHALDGFFNGLTAILKVPLSILSSVAGAFFSLFDGLDADKAKGAEKTIGGVSEALKPIKGVVDKAAGAWDRLVAIFDKLKTAVEPLLDNVAESFKGFAKKIADGIKNTNFDLVFSAIQTSLIGGIFLSIKKALSGGIGIDVGGGLLGNLSKTFEALTGNLEAMQKNIQAKTLLTIAAAVGVLAASVVAISLIDPKKVSSAMTTIAVGLGELGATLAILTKVTKGAGLATLPLIAAGMVGLAGAILILAGAMKIMSTMSWEGIVKGLVGVAGALAAISVGMKLMGGGPGLILQAAGIMIIAGALTVLAVAMKIFATMKWQDIAKGLVAIGAGLAIIAGAMKIMSGPEVLIAGAALVVFATGLTLLAGAVMSFGAMDMKSMTKGLLAMASALLIIIGALYILPPGPGMIAQAAGLVILGVALNGIASALKIMGGMTWAAVAKGLVTLGGALLILAGGLTLMSATLPGSAALLVAAGALALLAPALALIGALKWSTILKGLGALAATLALLALAGATVATPLAALGLAMLPLAAAFVLVAGAAYLFGKAMALISADGTKAVAVLIGAITAFIVAVPTMVINFLKGLVGIADAVVQIAPQLLQAIGVMLDQVIAFVITEAPKLAVAIGTLVDAIVQVLVTNAPKLISAGITLLKDLLSGIASNMSMVTTQVVSIVTTFLNGITNNMPKIVTSGVNLLVSFLKAITGHIPQLVATVVTLITSFVNAVGSQIPRIVKAAGNLIANFIGTISNALGRIIKAGTNLILNFLDGIGSAIPRIVNKGVEVIGKFLMGISNGLVAVENKGADAVIRFLNGTADAIRNKGPQLRAAGANLASALIEGLWQGLLDGTGKVRSILEWLANQLPGWAKRVLGIHSPSTVFAEIGGYIMQGLSVGISDGTSDTKKTLSTAADDVVSTAKDSFAKMPNLLEGMMDTEPKITPVLDLSSVQKDAQKLGDLTNVTPITAAVSYGQAAAISADQTTAAAAADKTPTAPSVQFIQNNTSPQALSEIEIYRQTKNQLSQIKSVVGLK